MARQAAALMTRKMLAAACALLALSTLASSCRQIIGIGPDSNVSDAGANEGGAAGVNASGPSLCDQYCDLESQVCTGPLGQYADRATCLAVCALLDISANGSFADANTVSCRLDRLRLAEQSTTVVRQVFCAQAGPGGGNNCTLVSKAPDCEGYCVLYRHACDGRSIGPFGSIDVAGTMSECIAKCRAIQPMSSTGYSWQAAMTAGDTLGCRLYFASAAAVDPAANCDFAGMRPTGPCLGSGAEPSCADFCLAVDVACTGDLKVYEDGHQCEAVCQAIDPGTKQSIEAVNTIGCRSAHAFNALLISARDHCPHVGPLGGGACGDGGSCESYCSLAKIACPDDFAGNYLDDDDCAKRCAQLEGSESGQDSVRAGLKGGNTAQCRGLAVSRALELPEADRADACAAVFGAAPCSD